MQFTKQSFMGIELDILVGHPEHDILFIATQVARAAGLKNPSHASMMIAKGMDTRFTLQFGSMFQTETLKKPKGVQATSWLFTEEATYKLLVAGRAAASEPFRKWVTEEVLPSIRKTGAYNVNESTSKEGVQFAGELAALHAEVSGLKAMIQQLLDRPAVVLPEAQQSPYEGITPLALCHQGGFDVAVFRELAAGLKAPSNAVHNCRRKGVRGITLKALIAENPISVPVDENL